MRDKFVLVYVVRGLPPRPFDARACCRLWASEGHLNLLKWAANRYRIAHESYFGAAEHGHVKILEWLKTRCVKLCSSTPWCAIKGGQVAALQWLLSNTKLTIENFGWWLPDQIEPRHLEMVKYLEERNVKPGGAMCIELICKGMHEHIRKYITPLNGVYIDPNQFKWALFGAAKIGDMELLECMLRIAAPVDRATACLYAAQGGQLKALQRLRIAGGELTAECFSYAAGSGSIPMLGYLLAAGCPFGRFMWYRAALSGHEHVAAWLRENTPAELLNAEQMWAAIGSWPALRNLHRWGCPTDHSVTIAAARYGRIRVLKWLISIGCPYDQHWCLDSADKFTKLQILRIGERA
jgi:hypothetical protein